jgi:hypothetical protein
VSEARSQQRQDVAQGGRVVDDQEPEAQGRPIARR